MADQSRMPLFDWPVRVYYEDTDAGGVVYHSNYISFMERARTEFLRRHDILLSEMERDHRVWFAVTALSVHFRRLHALMMPSTCCSDP